MSRRYEVQDADSRKAVLTMRATSLDVVRAMVIRGDVTLAMAPSGFVSSATLKRLAPYRVSR